MRALYGIGMGGYWGIGASFAMENAPRKLRGFLSGMMQGGYPFGYLLAAVGHADHTPGFRLARHVCGWLGAGGRHRRPHRTGTGVEAWKQHRMGSVGRYSSTLFQHMGSFSYLLLVMVVMSCLSHGTQDLYPDFLKTLPVSAMLPFSAWSRCIGIPILYNIGAITGALFFGRSRRGWDDAAR